MVRISKSDEKQTNAKTVDLSLALKLREESKFHLWNLLHDLMQNSFISLRFLVFFTEKVTISAKRRRQKNTESFHLVSNERIVEFFQRRNCEAQGHEKNVSVDMHYFLTNSLKLLSAMTNALKILI